MRFPIFIPTIHSPSIPSIPSPPSPPPAASNEYLVPVFIFLLYILYLIINCAYKRAVETDYTELPGSVETEAPVLSTYGGEKECVICLCKIEEEGEKCRKMKRCGHMFHKDCVDEWFMVEHRCPLCRILVVVDADGNTTDSSPPPNPLDRNHYIHSLECV